MRRIVEQVWERRSRSARVVVATLAPASWAFAVAAGLRARLYDRDLLTVQRASVPVVSVGNLSVGGTGKTPFVIWLAARLRDRGRSPVVVSRGYGRRSRRPATLAWTAGRAVGPPNADRTVIVPADGRSAVHDVGDEAVLVAARTGVPVFTYADRVEACRLAEQAWRPDLILLDDGFQHRRLARDLDIVLLRGDERSARMLPAGPLREPLSALRRADVTVGPCSDSSLPCIRRHPLGLVRSVWQAHVDEPIDRLCGRKVAAVAGVGRPDDFFETLAHAGADLRARLEFDDHHAYDRSDWVRIRARARGCDAVVTTEKDLVKLASVADPDVDLVALRLDVDVRGGDALLDRVAALDPRDRRPHDRSLRERGRA